MREAERTAGEAFSPPGPREEDWGLGPRPLEHSLPSSDTHLEPVGGLGWEVNAEGKAWGTAVPPWPWACVYLHAFRGPD